MTPFQDHGTQGVRPHGARAHDHHSGPFASTRWARLARAVGLEPDTPVAIALSGGADSVFLLHLVAAAEPRPRVLAVHVDHGLRAEASRADARFCADLCRALGIAFELRTIALERAGPSLEARAREARYGALCAAARAHGIAVIATGHHADDALETLLQRWIRGTDMAGLAGLKPRVEIERGMRGDERRSRAHELFDDGAGPIAIVRPLLALRREEVRRSLREHHVDWREDDSNTSRGFTRNRVRNELLPKIEELCGPDAIENLHAFGAAVEELEERCAALTAGLVWSPPLHAAARRGAREADLGGMLSRSKLMGLERPLARRALWRLLTEGSGHSPSRAVLERVVDDLAAGRCTRHALPGGWSLRLRSDLLLLEPPARAQALIGPTDPLDSLDPLAPAQARQLELAFAKPDAETGSNPAACQDTDTRGARLRTPGLLARADGRTLAAEMVDVPEGADVLRSPVCVELDAEGVVLPLFVRWPRPGDRFHALGAPGSKPLARFLADAGVPREDRTRVPLVVAGEEILWVAGIRPCEKRRVRSTTRARLRLSLHHPHPASAGVRPSALRALRADLFE